MATIKGLITDLRDKAWNCGYYAALLERGNLSNEDKAAYTEMAKVEIKARSHTEAALLSALFIRQ